MLSGADNGHGGEAVAGTELTTPAGSDLEVAALCRTSVLRRGTRATDDVLASSGGSAAGKDLEVPGASGVGSVADAVEALDGPLVTGSHHGDSSGGGSGQGASGGQESDERGGELHVVGWVG